MLAPARAYGQGRSGPENVPTFVLPVRTAPPDAEEPPPALPPEALDVTPSVLEVHAATDGPTAARQIVTRTVDRVLIESPGNREWLFVRSPTDVRRASAMWTDHATKTIVVYDDSDLRRTMGIRGWFDVIAPTLDAGGRRAPSGTDTVTVRQRHVDVDLGRVASPITRFPNYRQLDYADWLEGLHER